MDSSLPIHPFKSRSFGTQGASAFAKDGRHASLAQQRHLAVQGDVSSGELFEFRPTAHGFSLVSGQPGPVSIFCTISNGKMKMSFWSLPAPAFCEAKDLKLDLSHFVLLGWRKSGGEYSEAALKYREIYRDPRWNDGTPKIWSLRLKGKNNLSGAESSGKSEIMGSGVYDRSLLCWVVSMCFNYQDIFVWSAVA